MEQTQMGLDSDSMDFLRGSSTAAKEPSAPPAQNGDGHTPEPKDAGRTPAQPQAPVEPQRRQSHHEPGVTHPAGTSGDGGVHNFDLKAPDQPTPSAPQAPAEPPASEEFISEIPPRPEEATYDFGSSKYHNREELEKGFREKDRTIQQKSEQINQFSTRVQDLEKQILERDAEIQFMTSMFQNSFSEEADVIDLFAQQMLPEELKGKSESSFTINPDDYVVDSSKYDVNPDDYMDDDEYQEALREARRKRDAAQSRLDTRLRNDQSEAIRQQRDYIRAVETARQQVAHQLQQQKDQIVNSTQGRNDRIRTASEELRGEITGETLGIRNPEDEGVAERLLTKTVKYSLNGEDKSGSLAQVLPLIRADYGKAITDLIVQGMRHEIRGDVRPARPDAPPAPRPSAMPRARGPVGPTVGRTSDSAQESEQMFQEAGWTT